MWVWVGCLGWHRRGCGSVADGAAGMGVGLMVALPAWVWLGLYFGGFCGAGIGVDEIVEKKEEKKIIIVFIIF